jgi:outer membrane protein OmpA-like peptidoglycan-associated protein
MTTWIRGRFEGTYAGRIAPRPGGKSTGETDDSLHIHNVRLERGMVRDPETIDAPIVSESPTPNWIRQRELTHAMFPPLEGELAWRSVPLFDLRVVDWKLISPAAADGRGFGTVLGTVYARLTPEEVPAQAADDRGESPLAPSAAPADQKKEVEEAKEEPKEPLGVGWWLTIVAVVILTLGLGILCGAPTGLLWGTAMTVGLLLRRTLKIGDAHDHLVWRLFGIAVIGGHLALSWGPVNAWYETSCKPALADKMFWLALPVVVAALLPRKLPLVFTSLIWTVAMFSWCDELKGGSCALAAAVANPAPTEDTSPRVDQQGRWPRRPGGGRMPKGAFDVGDARASRLPGSTPGIAFPPLPTDFAGGPRDPGGPMGADGHADPGGDGSPSWGGAGRLPSEFPEHDLERPQGTSGSTTPIPDAGTVDPGPLESGTMKRTTVQDSPTPAGGTRGELLSLDQVVEAPERFFEAGGTARIYIPTDAFFGADGENIYEAQSGELSVLASLLRQYPGGIAIEVHTDARRSPRDMTRLAQLRANVVKQWLTRHEVEASRLTPVGIGSLRPIVPPLLHRVHQSANRRIEIQLLVPAAK